MRLLRQRSGQAVEMAETASAGLQAMQDGRDKALEELAEARATLVKRDRLVGSQDEAMVLLKKECEKAKREAKQNGKARRAGELTIAELHGLLERTKDEAASHGRILEEKMAMQVRGEGEEEEGERERERERERGRGRERERDIIHSVARMSVCERMQQTHTDTYSLTHTLY